MSEIKFTLGPWKSKYIISAGWKVVNIDENTIADIGWYQFPNSEMNEEISCANANLIAAAPEMYAYISEMIKRYPNSPWITDIGSKILAKAEGMQP